MSDNIRVCVEPLACTTSFDAEVPNIHKFLLRATVANVSDKMHYRKGHVNEILEPLGHD